MNKPFTGFYYVQVRSKAFPKSTLLLRDTGIAIWVERE